MNTPLKSAQRRCDNELPPEDSPEAHHSLPCVCGELAWFNVVNPGNAEEPPEITIKCKCGREGPIAGGLIAAVEAWNAKIQEASNDDAS